MAGEAADAAGTVTLVSVSRGSNATWELPWAHLPSVSGIIDGSELSALILPHSVLSFFLGIQVRSSSFGNGS